MKRVVVTGLGIISPVGNTVEQFWDSLINGKCGIGYITRFDTEGYKVRVAAEVKDFDPTRYMDPASTRRMDLFAQYAMAAAVMTMEDSGLEGKISPDRLGVYIGSGIGGLTTLIRETEKGMQKGYSRVSPMFIPLMIANMATSNVAIRFKAQGISLPVMTACATSANAVGEAFRAIKHGYADAIIAGGSEASLLPVAVVGFTNCMALSTKNDPLTACTPFDRERDGFVMGEGAAVLILEEYGHAVRRGANIYAEVVGYGNTCDAYHITSPEPSAEPAARAMELSMREAGISISEKVYINAHGTSTPLNDKTETLAIKNVFKEYAKEVLISSTKSMTGHMLGAAGAAEIIAAVLALKTGTIPPTIGYRNFDPECDLNYVPNANVKAEVDAALSNSFGFGGHNCCVALRPYRE
ncbi:MAG: beta-ketoacyl-ACP synthase II [Clostridiales bacterium]|jgi:3-oxoacyl-[acyl-carrier-protein] synthase II|nr:beta-ketoacyl-ACP synthase II [Clostridiales bacterium]